MQYALLKLATGVIINFMLWGLLHYQINYKPCCQSIIVQHQMDPRVTTKSTCMYTYRNNKEEELGVFISLGLVRTHEHILLCCYYACTHTSTYIFCCCHCVITEHVHAKAMYKANKHSHSIFLYGLSIQLYKGITCTIWPVTQKKSISLRLISLIIYNSS